MAGHGGAFDDLELIMDGNLHRARLLPHGSRTMQTSSHPLQNSPQDVDVDEDDDVAGVCQSIEVSSLRMLLI